MINNYKNKQINGEFWRSQNSPIQTIGGFSLLEIIFVIALVSILSFGGIKVFTGVRNNQILNKATNDVENALNEARSQTLSALDSSVYGVHLEKGNIILFKGDAYSSSDLSNKEIVLSNIVELKDITLFGGGSDVVFNKLIGNTDNYGTATVYLVSNSSKDRIVTIHSTGIVETE